MAALAWLVYPRFVLPIPTVCAITVDVTTAATTKIIRKVFKCIVLPPLSKTRFQRFIPRIRFWAGDDRIKRLDVKVPGISVG